MKLYIEQVLSRVFSALIPDDDHIISPNTKNEKPKQSFADKVQLIGKMLGGLLAFTYLVGLMIYTLHLYSMYVRSIELLRIRYIFIGFYFLLFLVIQLAVPFALLKRKWVIVAYLFILLFTIIISDDSFLAYIQFKIEMWTSGKSYFHFNSSEVSIVKGNLLSLCMLFMASCSFWAVKS